MEKKLQSKKINKKLLFLILSIIGIKFFSFAFSVSNNDFGLSVGAEIAPIGIGPTFSVNFKNLELSNELFFGFKENNNLRSSIGYNSGPFENQAQFFIGLSYMSMNYNLPKEKNLEYWGFLLRLDYNFNTNFAINLGTMIPIHYIENNTFYSINPSTEDELFVFSMFLGGRYWIGM